MRTPALFRPRKGFTLIELLTVIAIIGILAAIIIPVVGKVRTSAMLAQSTSNLRQISNAVLLWANDNKGDIPVAVYSPESSAPPGFAGNWRENLVRRGYLSRPDTPVGANTTTGLFTDSTNFSVLGSPIQRRLAPHLTTEQPNKPRLYTYAMNSSAGDSAAAIARRKIQRYVSPSATLMLCDGLPSSDNLQFHPGIHPAQAPQYCGDSVTLVYMDGHTSRMPLADFPTSSGLTFANSDDPKWMFWFGQR